MLPWHHPHACFLWNAGLCINGKCYFLFLARDYNDKRSLYPSVKSKHSNIFSSNTNKSLPCFLLFIFCRRRNEHANYYMQIQFQGKTAVSFTCLKSCWCHQLQPWAISNTDFCISWRSNLVRVCTRGQREKSGGWWWFTLAKRETPERSSTEEGGSSFCCSV